MELTIRTLTREDLPALLRLYAQLHESLGFDKNSKQAFILDAR